MKTVRVRAGRERSLLRRHPWVFEGSVDKGRADAGETVRVEDAAGRFLAWAAYSPHSQIRLRAWSFDEAERIDATFFARRLDAAIAYRERLAVASDGVRLVHGEADGLPGLVVDRFAGVLSVQFNAVGVERHREAIVAALAGRTGVEAIFERSDASSREREGLAGRSGWLRGGGGAGGRPDDDGDAPAIVIREHGLRFRVGVGSGQKTGFYLDQRDNRRFVAETVRRLGLERVLDAYCYSGGFGVAALAAGAAQVTAIDSSRPALEAAAAHVELNGLDASRHDRILGDVNGTLRGFVEAGRRFDAIVLDPPKLAPTAAHAERAARAYKDVNRLAFGLLRPGGVLFTFSCSGGIAPDLFHKIVAGAGLDAGVDGRLLARMGAAADHPASVVFPEGDYLKGLAIVSR